VPLFEFHAVRPDGRIEQGVLEAESPETARDALRAAGLFPKRLGPAAPDATRTWAPRTRRREDDPASHHYRGPREGDTIVRAAMATRRVLPAAPPVPGRLGLTARGSLLFEPTDAAAPRAHAEPEAIETARLLGFPRRLLCVTLLDGRMLEFEAGWLFAAAPAREIARALAANTSQRHGGYR
jgi:hypothetical protein